MKILIIGKHGMLAQELLQNFHEAGGGVVCKGRPEVDLCKPDTIREVLLTHHPSVIINAAAYTAVDRAESHPDPAFAVNRDGTRCLAEHSHRLGIPLIHISTDYVFDGKKRRPYREDDPVSPLGVYGQSKWEGEEAVRRCQPHHIILRTSWLYGLYGRNFLKTILNKAKETEELRIIDDQWGCPTWAKDVASALAVITRKVRDANEVPWGTYHFCSAGETTWYEFGRTIIDQAREFLSLKIERITPIATDEYPAQVKRPAYSVLDCSKIHHAFDLRQPQWQESAQRCLEELSTCPDLLHAPS